MVRSADYAEIAEQARRIYAEQLVKGLPAMVNCAGRECQPAARQADRARALHAPARTAARTAEGRRGLAQDHGQRPAQRAAQRRVGGAARRICRRPTQRPLSLVDDDTIEREILTSRLALAMMDRAACGIHRPARAHGAARTARGTRAAGHAACPCAGAHRRRCLAVGRLQPGQLARAAVRSARGVRGAGRRGLPRDQPLAGRPAACCPRSTCAPSSAARATCRRRPRCLPAGQWRRCVGTGPRATARRASATGRASAMGPGRRQARPPWRRHAATGRVLG